MKPKTVLSLLLLVFVALSLAFAFRKIAPESASIQQHSVASKNADVLATPMDLRAKLAETKYSAVYFHAPHRCPTCRKIESFAHAALTPEIESGDIAWQTADYTATVHDSLVKQFKVFTATIVLVEVEDGQVIRWKNLEEVWNHTSDQEILLPLSIKPGLSLMHRRKRAHAMSGYWIAAGSALWLGILTSISPCPLATNIAAISYVSRSLGQSWKTIASSLLYTLGRVLAYTSLGALIVASLLSAPGLAVGLQKYLNLFLGPLLILVGMILLGLIELPVTSGQRIQRLREKFEKLGSLGSALLGLLFALSFCPVSAALFFGSLIPLAVKLDSSVLLPALYGVGTGVPVLVFAMLLVFGKQSVSAFFRRVTSAETWLRRITGGSILAVGIYITLQQIYLS